MHELSFADAVRPEPTVVLNLPLAEYSIGHELLLLQRRNALVLLAPAEFNQLEFSKQIYAIREAVWICSDPYRVRERCERPARFMWRFRWNEWKRQRWCRTLTGLLPQDYALAAAEFRNYLETAHPRIPTPGKHAIEVLYGDEEKSGRSLGQPMVLSLYQYVLTLPSSDRPACAWDFPFARAMWLFFAHAESSGSYRIENFEERDEQSVMDEARAGGRSRKAEAGGQKSEGEHPTPGGAQSNIQLLAERNRTSNAGLATAVPDLGENIEHPTPNAEHRSGDEGGERSANGCGPTGTVLADGMALPVGGDA